MACHLFHTKPLPKPMMTYCQLDRWDKIGTKIQVFIQENLFENVFPDMVAFRSGLNVLEQVLIMPKKYYKLALVKLLKQEINVRGRQWFQLLVSAW